MKVFQLLSVLIALVGAQMGKFGLNLEDKTNNCILTNKL